jgi:hypothetical protein
MTAAAIIKKAIDDGVNLVLSGSENIRLSGNQSAVNRWVAILREHKQAIIALLTHNQESTIRTWLKEIGEPVEDHNIVMDKCRLNPETLIYYLEQATEYKCEKQQQNILNLLAENTDRKHVYVTNPTVYPGNVVLTFAIRGVATFDILIPKNTYDPFVLQEIIENGSLQ